MHTSRFVLLGGLTVVGALLAVSSGCGDDDSGTGGSGAASSSSSSSSGGQGGKAEGGGGGSADAVSCAAYCTEITANCSGPGAQFGSEATCLTTCEAWEVGTIDDRMVDTLGCHLYHAGAAKMDPTVHCPHAGPAGAGQCGTIVENFCDIAAEVCPDAFQDAATCESDVAGLDADAPYSAASTSGDTLACRLYHLTAASESEMANTTHCPHIAVATTDMSPCKP